MTTRTSMWLSRDGRPSRSPLTSDLDVEVAVVGAGWVGLHAALLAQRGGAEVAIVEADLVGTGTTGYSTAKLTSQHSLIYAELVRRHGTEVAGQYAAAQLAGIEVVISLVDELGIDCDLTEAPAIAYTLDDDRRADIENEAAAAATLGLPARVVGTAGLPVDVAAAVSFDQQYHLDPVRYLDGLADAFVANGGMIFEHTRVQSVDEQRDHRVRLSTEYASVRANQAIVATLLPIGMLGGYFARTRPIGTYGLAVRLGQEAPPAMTIAVDSPSWSTRPWPAAGPKGLLILGNGHEVGEAGRTADRQQELENWARSTFEIETVDHRWFAHDYATPDLLPYVGPTPTSRSILVATGFAKWGLSNGAAAAIILADRIAGRDNGWAAPFDATRIGDGQAVGKLIKDNLQVGKEFITRFGSKGPKCTHLGCPLHWNAADGSWDCNCHGSRFDATGSVLTGPATKPLDLGQPND